MPLVVICGYPCSGKSTRAKELEERLKRKYNINVKVISDDSSLDEKNQLYIDAAKEKELRSSLKSEVQRNISKTDVVILDSCNYIKGYRYELFCLSKAAKTTHCVIHTAINAKDCWQWNENSKQKYTREVLDAVIQRFEEPDSRNRWDSPLFTVHSDEDLPIADIYDALFVRKAPPPNQSTQSQPLAATNYLHELDNITQEIIKKTHNEISSLNMFIVASVFFKETVVPKHYLSKLKVVAKAQSDFIPGDKIFIRGAADKIILTRNVTMAELARQRRQFIAYTKMHPVEDTTKLPNLFVQYLNKSII